MQAGIDTIIRDSVVVSTVAPDWSIFVAPDAWRVVAFWLCTVLLPSGRGARHCNGIPKDMIRSERSLAAC